MVFIPPKPVREPNSSSVEGRTEKVKIVETSKITSSPQKPNIDKTERKRQFPKGSSSNLAKNLATKKQRIEGTGLAPDSFEADGNATVGKSYATNTTTENSDAYIVSQVGIGLRNKLLTSAARKSSSEQMNDETKNDSRELIDLDLEQRRIKFMSLPRNFIDFSKVDSDLD